MAYVDYSPDYTQEYIPEYIPTEKKIHEKIFDTISRPLSRQTEKGDSMGLFSGKKVKWNHFGKKYALRISDYEMEYSDVYDALMKKILEVRPDFDGALAYIDLYGRQVIFNNDKELREALSASKGKLKIHTTLPEGGVMSAADIAGRPARSQSVPPTSDRAYHTYHGAPHQQSRSPSSLDSAPPNMRNRSPPHQIRNRSASPPPHISSPSGHSNMSGKQMANYPPVPPPGYSYKMTTYPGMYSQNVLYGMPPHNGMLLRFLANPFPFGAYQRSWVGPNKYHNFGNMHGFAGGYGGGRYYSGSSWGPYW